MSFLATWIWEIAAMYMTNHKEVLLVGDRGDQFSISCFVCQGCPLAPTLSFFCQGYEEFSSNIGDGPLGALPFNLGEDTPRCRVC